MIISSLREKKAFNLLKMKKISSPKSFVRELKPDGGHNAPVAGKGSLIVPNNVGTKGREVYGGV